MTASLIASVVFKFHFWYSFFLVGAVSFFGCLNFLLHAKQSVYRLFLEWKWRKFIPLYLISLCIGILVDIIFGRTFGRLWIYPHLFGFWNFIIPVFIYYPLGGNHIYEIYVFIRRVLKGKISNAHSANLSDKSKKLISQIFIIFLPIGIMLPIITYVFHRMDYLTSIVIFSMVLTMFSFDAIMYRIKKESILIDILQGNIFTISTLLICYLLVVILNELPNVFSQEWIYQNVPFVHFEIFGVNTLIFTFGWFFLVLVSIRFTDFVKYVLKIDE